MIYITGANGWLGLNLINNIVNGNCLRWGMNKEKIHALIQEGSDETMLRNISYDIEIHYGDIRNLDKLNKFLSSSKNSFLFHTAGVIHPNKIADFFSINTIGTENLINSAIRHSIKRMVIVSSNSPCGCNSTNKDLFNEQSNYNPYMNYGKSKMEMEIIANEKYKKGYIDLTIIRAPWFYGPFQPARQKLFFEMIKNGKVPLIGSGNNIRSMAYTNNLVQGLILAATKPNASGNTYWIADEKPYTMNNIIDTIEKLLAEEFNQNCNFGRIKLPNIISSLAEHADRLIQSLGFYNQKIHVLSEMNKNIACSVRKAQSELDYKPEFSLITGMHNSLKEIYGK